MGTPEMNEAKHKSAKMGGSWNLPTIDGTFGWLRNWDWMATLFLLVTAGLIGQSFIDEKPNPDPGKFSVILAPFWLMAVGGLNGVKEYYERKGEQRREKDNSELMTRVGHLEAENELLRERIAELTGGN